MGIVFRQTIKATGVIFTGALLGAAITYVQAWVFTPTQLGAARNLITQGGVLYLFLLMGSISLAHTYVQRYETDDPRRQVLLTFSLLVPLFTTLLFCIPYFLLKEFVINRYQGFDRQYIREFYSWLPLLGLLWSYMMLLEYYLASMMKVALGNAMREVVLRLGNIVLIALFYAGLIDFQLFVISTVVIHIVPVAVLYYLASRTKGFGISFRWSVFSREDIRSIVHYAWYHMLLTVSLNLVSMLDVLLLAALSRNGLKDVAVYNIAVFLISILSIPYRAMSGAAFPRLNQSFVADDGSLESLFTRSAINMQLVSVGMWLLVACNLHNAQAILPPAFAPLAPCFLILSIGRMVDMGSGLNTELISITNHYKFTFRISLLLLVSIIGLGRIFIPLYGLYGAAWVATGTLLGFNLIKVAFLYRKMRLSPFNRQTAVIAGCGAVLYGLNFLSPALGNPYGDAVLRSALILAAYGGLLLLLRPSPDLSEFLNQVRKNRRLF